MTYTKTTMFLLSVQLFAIYYCCSSWYCPSRSWQTSYSNGPNSHPSPDRNPRSGKTPDCMKNTKGCAPRTAAAALAVWSSQHAVFDVSPWLGGARQSACCRHPSVNNILCKQWHLGSDDNNSKSNDSDSATYSPARASHT